MALQTKTFTVGDLAWASWSNAYLMDLVLTEESVDALTNTSVVSYKLQLRSGKQNRFAEDVSSVLSFDGAQIDSNREYKYLDFNSVWVLLSGQMTVTHGDDGSKNLTFRAVATPDKGNQWAPPEMVIEGQLPLTQIPRASTLGATAAFIEDRASVVVTKRSQSYSHSIFFQFGTRSGYIDRDGEIKSQEVKYSDSLVLFRLPSEFYLQIPDKSFALCTLTCRTYLGNQLVGQPQSCQFVVQADPLRCGPQLTGSLQEAVSAIGELTNKAALLPGYSGVYCNLTPQVFHGATVRFLTINGQPAESGKILPVTDGKYLARVVDSRGFWCEKLLQMPIISYKPVGLQVTAKRESPTSNVAVLQINGKWFDGSFGKINNTLSLTYRVGSGQPVTLTPQFTAGGFSATVTISELDYQESHNLVVEATDRVGTYTAKLSVNRGTPVFQWGPEDFVFHVPVQMPRINCVQIEYIMQRLAALEAVVGL